ncbi:MAG: hypothetical protein D4S02_16805 [Rhodocyclaceae bacterium]|nr:MAG: hypothetical protein D4S02_16805 [Rhodocyclaceae bacterium]
MELSAEDLQAECRARVDVYRLLAGVFVEEPSPVFLAALRSPQALQQFAESGLSFDADFTDVTLDTLVETLACEYTTLFANSGGFPPVESVRLTGRYKQDPHFEIAETYRRLGFVLRKGRFEVFPDQLGIELMFIAEMLERAATALDADNEPKSRREYRRLEREIKRFWTLHPGRWVRGYSRLIERAAEHSFYREMARLLGGFAAEEIAAMGLRIEDSDKGQVVVPKAEVRIEFDANEPVCTGHAPERASNPGADHGRVHPLRDLR